MERAFSQLLDAVIRGQTDVISTLLARDPALVTRSSEAERFVEEAVHQLYRGDTALHMAAAAFQRPAAELLVHRGADCRARNRRGAEPLHYAADANHWDPVAQGETIAFLLRAGADPNALDKSGVSALHRAVRTRSSAAVRALLAGGADVSVRNRSGSTPLHLAVQDTGRGGAGLPRARSEQERIIEILLEAGSRPADRDGKGNTVPEVASQSRIRAALDGK